jgi:hypothetical protein
VKPPYPPDSIFARWADDAEAASRGERLGDVVKYRARRGLRAGSGARIVTRPGAEASGPIEGSAAPASI